MRPEASSSERLEVVQREVHQSPRFPPDGRRFLFLVCSGREDVRGLYVTSLDAPDKRRRVAEETWPSYAAGHLLFVRNGSLMAQPFDPGAAKTAGEPAVIADGAGYATGLDGSPLGCFAASSGSAFLYFSRLANTGLVQFAWADRTGRQQAAFGDPGNYGALSLSPDGRQVAFEVRDQKLSADIWVMDLSRGVPSRVTATSDQTENDAIRADGGWLAYQSEPSGRYEVYIEPFRREGERVRVSIAGGFQPRWRQDGKELFYVAPNNELKAVDVRLSLDRVEVGTPKALFALAVVLEAQGDDYAPRADGQTFLINVPAGGGVQRLALNVVSHWPSLLKKP